MDFDIIVEKSTRKTLVLKVLDAKTIKIKAPFACSDRLISDFINKKADWIAQKRHEIEKEGQILKNLIDFKKIMYFGALYGVISDKNIKSVLFKDGIFYVPDIDLVSLKLKIKRFFVRMSQIFLEKALKERANSLDLQFNSIKTNVYKTKWGSCNSKKDIKLNAALIMLNKNIIDYVITHELCHLKHLNHSKTFWKSVENVIPNYKRIKSELKRYNFVLKIFT